MKAKLVLRSLLLILLDSCVCVHHHAMDPSSVVFFVLEDLKVGNTIPTYFPKRELSDSFSHLLSKQEADSIPFSSQQLPHILRLLSFSADSPQAKAMAETLDECERAPIRREKKFCATSLESMSEFLQTVFGSGAQIKPLSTAHLKGSENDAVLQMCAVEAIERVPAPKMVSCHTMPYAYSVLYCHYHESENRVYRVALRGENGDEVEAVAVCHMDTSEWGPNHVAFQALALQPGSAPVCHFFPADNFVWVPTPTTTTTTDFIHASIY